MSTRTVYQLTDLAFPVTVEQDEDTTFRVTYGKQVKQGLTYEEGALELGLAIFHALACDDKLNNEGD